MTKLYIIFMYVLVFSDFASAQKMENYNEPVLCEPESSVVFRDNFFGKDKAKHFLASMIITGGSAWVAKHRFGLDTRSGMTVGISIGLSVGIMKEVADNKNPRKQYFSWRDIVADIAGVIAGSIFLAW